MRKIKRIIIISLTFLLLLSNITFTESIKININGNLLKTEVNPIMKEGRILVPLRAIFEALGVKVDWDNDTRTATGTKETKIIKLQINNKIAQVDGKEVILDVPGTVIDGSTFVPVRFIAESLGAKVNWDGVTKTVTINSNIKRYKVTRVVDGDTIKVDFNGKEESVRLIGIDTPESVNPDASKNVLEGKIASDYTKSRLEGKEVELEFDVQERDRYGRLLAYVWIGGEMFNKTLLSEGYAQVATFPPNVKYVDEFIEFQRRARENNKGFWAYDNLLIDSTAPTQNETTSKEVNTTFNELTL